MTDDRLPLAELLAKTGDADFLRAAAEAVVQLIMEADVEGQIGAPVVPKAVLRRPLPQRPRESLQPSESQVTQPIQDVRGPTPRTS